MAENLRYLPSVSGPSTASPSTPHYYVYGYNGTSVSAAKATADYATYGVLYNITAALNECPAGWHLPSDAEWNELEDYLNCYSSIDSAGTKLKEAGSAHWITPSGLSIVNQGTDETGFTALPGGKFGGSSFGQLGSHGYWWTSTVSTNPTGNHNSRLMHCDFSYLRQGQFLDKSALAIRCIKD